MEQHRVLAVLLLLTATTVLLGDCFTLPGYSWLPAPRCPGGWCVTKWVCYGHIIPIFPPPSYNYVPMRGFPPFGPCEGETMCCPTPDLNRFFGVSPMPGYNGISGPVTESSTTEGTVIAQPTTTPSVPIHPVTERPVTEQTVTAQQNTAEQVTAQHETAEQVTAQQETAEQVTAQQDTAQKVIERPVTAQQITEQPETAEQVTAERVTAERVTAEQITAH